MKDDTSTSKKNCHSRSGQASTGAVVTFWINWFNASVCFSSHINGTFFFVSSVRGLAIKAYPLINGLWYPRISKVCLSSFKLRNLRGHSTSPTAFEGSTVTPSLVTNHPRNSTEDFSNSHFPSF